MVISTFHSFLCYLIFFMRSSGASLNVEHFEEHLRYERSLLCMSCWNFATTQNFVNKNNYMFLNVKKHQFCDFGNTTFILSFHMKTFKNIAIHNLIARLDFHQVLRIRPIFNTLVVCYIFPFCSICQVFCNIFFDIAVCLSVLYIKP